MERELAKEDGGFRNAVFSASEIDYCEGTHSPARHYAARFAAREAIIKAFGGVPESGFSWLDIEIGVDEDGEPRVELKGAMKGLADERGITAIHCALSHTRTAAMAYVIMEA
jgi:holo-[acyl-carrier protein] synthase